MSLEEPKDGWKCLRRAVASWSALWSRDPSADFTALNKILAAHNPFDSSSVEPRETSGKWVRLSAEAIPQNTAVMMRRTGSPQIPMWEVWQPLEPSA